MGSRKFLIVLLSVLLALSTVFIFASASSIEEKNAPVVKSPPADFQIPSGDAFSTVTYIGTPSGDNSYRGRDLVSNFTSTNPILVTYVSIQAQNLAGVWLSPYSASFDEPVSVYCVGNNGWLYVYVDGQRVDSSWYEDSRVRVVFQNSVDELEPRGGLVLYEIEPSFKIGALFSGMISVWSRFVVFVSSSWVVSLPLIAFVLVICISAIRRLVKGV